MKTLLAWAKWDSEIKMNRASGKITQLQRGVIPYWERERKEGKEGEKEGVKEGAWVENQSVSEGRPGVQDLH